MTGEVRADSVVDRCHERYGDERGIVGTSRTKQTGGRIRGTHATFAALARRGLRDGAAALDRSRTGASRLTGTNFALVISWRTTLILRWHGRAGRLGRSDRKHIPMSIRVVKGGFSVHGHSRLVRSFRMATAVFEDPDGGLAARSVRDGTRAPGARCRGAPWSSGPGVGGGLSGAGGLAGARCTGGRPRCPPMDQQPRVAGAPRKTFVPWEGRPRAPGLKSSARSSTHASRIRIQGLSRTGTGSW